ncbi:MAG: long-chain fatty acid--CoA ligase [Cryobacterium sp.]|nr:long-chain fatty acid--CoA ligase [Oligoflexia bacterium]
MAFVVEKTIGAALLERVRRTPGTVGFRYRSKNDVIYPSGQWREVSFLSFSQECEQLALGLKASGLQRGEHVAIISKTRYEWTLADLAIQANAAITVTLYPSTTAAETFELLLHSEAKIAFVENEEQLMKILPRWSDLPELRKVIVFESDRPSFPARVTSLFEMQNAGEIERHHSPHFFRETLESLQPEDVFTLCYTSGTTGAPKGVLLSHENLMSVLNDCAKVYQDHVRDGKEVLLTFLPFSHIIGRIESMSPFVFGWQLNYADSVEKIPENLLEIRPTVFFSVPRIFEKALAELKNRVEKAPLLERQAYQLALSVGENFFWKRRRGKNPGPVRGLGYTVLRQTVLKRVIEAFGGRLRFAICGGAPLSREIAEAFEVLGILVLEGYGLTETCAPVALNTVEHHRFGTVGRPLPDVTVKIQMDGEISIRSKKVFRGYWKNESETRDAFDDDGWFRTGDIGFIDPQGYLHITDRKKDLIITSGGKNASPQKIETRAKALSPLISDFVVLGDRRKHLSALITLERKALHEFARQRNILYSDPAEFTRNQAVLLEVERVVAELNVGLARFETIKKFVILPNVLSVEAGELTPSHKVKRSAIQRKYLALIDAMYHEDASKS